MGQRVLGEPVQLRLGADGKPAGAKQWTPKAVPWRAVRSARRLRAGDDGSLYSVLMSSRLTKKSVINVAGRSVKTPRADCAKLAFRARMRR